jgi:hypothetical protein
MTEDLKPGSTSPLIASSSAPNFASSANSSVLLTGKAPLEPPNHASCPTHPSHILLLSLLCLLISLPLRIVLLPFTPGDDLFSSVCHIRLLPLLCSQKNDAHPYSEGLGSCGMRG